MKKILFALLLLITLASVQAQIQVGNVLLGGESQDRGVRTSTTVTITNTGNLTISDLTATVNEVNAIFDSSHTLTTTTLAPGATAQLTIDAYVPLDLDAVDSRGRKINVDIGDVVIDGSTSSGDVSRSVQLLMEAENRLEFGSSDIIIEGDSSSLRDGRDYEANRGDSVDLEIQVENTFDDSGDCDEGTGDCDIEDVEIIVESDTDLDVDEDADLGTIRADDEDTETISFNIDRDADDDDYDVEIWVTGFDENGARHGEEMEITIEVDVPSDEVSITRIEMFPEVISCQRTTTVDVTIENTGRNDLDDISLILESSRLDVDDAIFNIVLDEGDITSRTFNLRIPSNTQLGQYYIQVIANVDGDEEVDRDAVTLYVEECQPDDDDDDQNGGQDGTDDDDDDVNVIDVPPTGGVIIGRPQRSEGFFNSTEYMILLIVLLFIALLLLLLLVGLLVKR